MNYRRYLIQFFGASLGIAGLIAAITVGVDPYATFRWSDIRGLNDQKTLKRDGGRVNKAIILDRYPFDLLLYGTSQCEVGVDPASEIFQGLSVFNASLSNTNMYETSQVMAYATQRQSPRLVVMGLDWFLFSSSQVTAGDFQNSGFAGASHLPAYLKRTLGLHALRDSFNVVGRSWRHKPQVFTKFGHVDPSVRGTYDYVNEFRTSVETYLRMETHPGHPPELRHQHSFPSMIYDPGKVGLLGNMLTPVLDKGAKVLLFISPVHAAYLEALIGTGRLSDYEQWKRDMTAMVAAVNKGRPGAVALWDFSGYNSITTEPVPVSPAGKMRWHWDSAHFSAAAGDLVIARMLGRDAPSGPVPDDFGVELFPDTIEAVLQRVRDGHAGYSGSGRP